MPVGDFATFPRVRNISRQYGVALDGLCRGEIGRDFEIGRRRSCA